MESFKLQKNILDFKIYTTIIFFLFANLAFAGPEAPEYIRTKNWNIEKANAQTIILTADIVFFNPNNVKAKLRELDLDIYMNEKMVGKLLQQDKVKIKANSSFDIPIRIKIDLAKTQLNLTNLIGLFSNQNFIVNLKGYLKARVYTIPFKIKIDEKEEFKLKDFF